jgi:hypothetical protein
VSITWNVAGERDSTGECDHCSEPAVVWLVNGLLKWSEHGYLRRSTTSRVVKIVTDGARTAASPTPGVFGVGFGTCRLAGEGAKDD